jgi:hypothetical protein
MSGILGWRSEIFMVIRIVFCGYISVADLDLTGLRNSEILLSMLIKRFDHQIDPEWF